MFGISKKAMRDLVANVHVELIKANALNKAMMQQVIELQAEKRELWNKLFAVIAKNINEYHMLTAAVDHPPDDTSDLYSEDFDDEHKIGEVIEGSPKD